MNIFNFYNIKIIFTAIFLLQIIACSSKKEKNQDKTILYFTMAKIEEPKLKDVFSSIEIDTLEFSDKSIIGKRFQGKFFISILNKYYIITDDRYVINIFNNEGIFISSSINCVGEGPGKYFIMQDVAYNDAENTIEVLDPFGNIFVYDINFNFLHKIKVAIEPKEKFRYFYPLQKDFYALIDNTEKSTIHLFNSINKKSKKIRYDGMIAPITANQSPFRYVEKRLYFTPPEINNNVFIFDPQSGILTQNLLMEGSNWIKKSDVEKFNNNLEDISRYISMESQKYAPLNRFINQEYAITMLLKQGGLYINIYNRITNKNKTFSKSPSYAENIPNCVHLEGNVMYALIEPSEINDFIDVDLVENKDILKTLKLDDNPCVVKYKLKI